MLALDGVHFAIGDRERRLRFTYAALLALYETWGEEFEKRVAEAILLRKLKDLCEIVAHTTATAGDVAMTVEEVIAASPAIEPLCLKLEIAWAWAYRGFEAAKQFEAIAEREARAHAKAEAAPKKTLLSRFTSAFGTLTRTPSAAA